MKNLFAIVIIMIGTVCSVWGEVPQAEIKIIQPRTGEACSSQVIQLMAEIRAPLSEIAVTAYLNDIPAANLEVKKIGYGVFIAEGTVSPSFIGAEEVTVSIRADVKRGDGVRYTAESDKVKVHLRYDSWLHEGGDPYRSRLLPFHDDLTVADLRWQVKLDGEVTAGPIVAGRKVFSAAAARDGITVRAHSLETGESVWTSTSRDWYISGQQYTLNAMAGNVDGSTLFLLVQDQEGNSKLQLLDTVGGRPMAALSDFGFITGGALLPVPDPGRGLSMLVAGVKEAPGVYQYGGYRIQSQYVYVVEEVSSTGLVSEVITIPLESYLADRYRKTSSPGMVYAGYVNSLESEAVVTVHGNTVHFIYRTADGVFAGTSLTIKGGEAASAHSMLPVVTAYGSDRILLFTLEQLYYKVYLNAEVLQEQRLYNVFAEDSDNFAQMDGQVIDYVRQWAKSGHSGIEFLLRRSDIEYGRSGFTPLSYDANYEELSFVQAFSVPPLVGNGSVLAVDKNYSLFLLEGAVGSNGAEVLKIDLSAEALEQKRNLGMIPFGNYGNTRSTVSGAYYRQPAPAAVENCVVLATGERAPNYLLCWEFGR
jgi:hypothetical protein